MFTEVAGVENKDLRLLIKIAQMYYEENATQRQIASRLGVSRPTVSRLLQKARQQGIVEIKINYSRSFANIEKALEQKYNIKECIIVPYAEGETLKKNLAEAAADHLIRHLKPGDIVGVSWGTTLAYIPFFLLAAPSVEAMFVPLVGGVGQTMLDIHSNQIVINLAKAFHGSWRLLHVPAIVDSERVKDTLLSDNNISNILELGKKANIALIGIGSPLSSTSTMLETGYFSEEVIKDLKLNNAVCDVCSYFINENGELCDAAINSRVIGVSPDDIKKIHHVVGIAGGQEKHEAVLAALRAKLLDVIITDDMTANFLISKN